MFDKVIVFMIVGSVIMSLCMGASAQTFRPFPEAPLSGMSQENFLGLELKDYPMTVIYPKMQSLLVRSATDPGALFAGFAGKEWKIDTTNPPSVTNSSVQVTLRFKGTNGKIAWAGFAIGANALLQLQETIKASAVLLTGIQIQTTWQSANGRAKVIPVEGASFVANTGETAPSTDIIYSLQNIVVYCGNDRRGGADTQQASRDECIALTQIPLQLFRKTNDIKLLDPKKEVKLSVSQRTYDAAIVTWVADGARKDDWVRIEVEAGDLAIIGPGQVLVGNIPKAGTVLHCYSISANGKEWYHTSVALSGDPRK